MIILLNSVLYAYSIWAFASFYINMSTVLSGSELGVWHTPISVMPHNPQTAFELYASSFHSLEIIKIWNPN